MTTALRSRHTLASLVACAALVVCTAGCGGLLRHAVQRTPSAPAPHAVPVGSSTQTLTVDGITRTFHLYRPEGLPSAAPLVVMLHGGFGSGAQAERSYGWDAQADQDHFLVAYPDGLHRAWNAGGGCCGTPAADHVDDVAFLSSMVTTIEEEVPVDPHRVFATGISNGGMMAYRLACDTTLFAAIGPDSATLMGPCPHPAPVSVIHIHGTADHNIPYGGGPGDGPGHVDGPSVPSLNATWRGVDSCAPSHHRHPGGGHHLGGRLPGRAVGGAGDHRRGGAPVAGLAVPAGDPEGARPRPALHRPRRHSGDLAVLRRPSRVEPGWPPGGRTGGGGTGDAEREERR